MENFRFKYLITYSVYGDDDSWQLRGNAFMEFDDLISSEADIELIKRAIAANITKREVNWDDIVIDYLFLMSFKEQFDIESLFMRSADERIN